MRKDDGFKIEDGVLLEYTGEDKSVTVPSDVSVIGDGAFFRCTGIVSVKLPDGVVSIGRRAFCDCLKICFCANMCIGGPCC